MKLITHEILANVETGQCTINPTLDIIQGDSNSHILLIKLRNSEGGFVSISESGSAKIQFYDSVEGTLIISSAVAVVNPYRGVLSYTIGPAVVKDNGRKTVYLDVSNCGCNCECGPSISFTMTVSKSNCYSGGTDDSDVETTITVEEYNRLMDHLNNDEIHLDEGDRELIDYLEQNEDKVKEVIDTDFDKLIEEKVEDISGQVMKQAFITVDYLYPNPLNPDATSLHGLTPDEVCEGKIVRVNYLNSDGDSSTMEPPPYEGPGYYVAVKIGDHGDIEWVPWEYGGSDPELVERVNDIDRHATWSDFSDEIEGGEGNG